MKMQTLINKRMGKFWLEAVWLPNNAPCLFKFALVEIIDCSPLHKEVVILGLQIIKASLGFGFDIS